MDKNKAIDLNHLSVLEVNGDFTRKIGGSEKVKIGADPKKSGNLEEDILNFTNKINKFLEEKIIEKPEEWFWLHNRWDIRFN